MIWIAPSEKDTDNAALRASWDRNCAATRRDLRGAQDDRGDISIYGQESNATRPLAVMNLVLRGIVADVGDCMVALPGQLFYSTQIPVCLWFLAKNKVADAKRGFCDRKLGTLIDHVHRELTDEGLKKINPASAKFSLN